MSRPTSNSDSPTSCPASEAAVVQVGSGGCPAGATRLLRSTAGQAHRESPTRRELQSPHDGRMTQSSAATARRSGSCLWTSEETSQLSSLVACNSASGRVNWVALHREWQSLGLSIRTKAALQARWRTIPTIVPPSGEVLAGGECGLNPQGETAVPPESSTSWPTSATPHPTPTTSGRSAQEPIDSCESSDHNTVNGDAGPRDADADDRRISAEVKSAFAKTLSKASKASTRSACVLPRRVDSKRAFGLISLVGQCVKDELLKTPSPELTWEKVTATVFAGASTVTQFAQRESRNQAKEARLWFGDTKKKLDRLRSDIGKATTELERRKSGKKPSPKQIRNLRELRKQHRVETGDELATFIHRAKEQLRLLKERYEARKEECDRRKLRSSFSTGGLSRLCSSSTTAKTPPDVQAVRGFWRKIVGISKPFNPNDANLVAWAKSLESDEAGTPLAVTWDDFKATLQKAKPWKAPGPDGIQAFWWKVFDQAAKTLFHLASRQIAEGSKLPSWLTNGRVVLIHKSGSHEDPANYRPIACLNTSYKLVTSLLAVHLSKHADKLSIIPNEQVAIRKGTWGCTHACVLDQATVADATNQKQKPLHVAWIDYAKAFDSVPHAYLKWLLKCMGVDPKTLEFISGLLTSWTVQYEARSPTGGITRSARLKVKSGVLQGDSFSPFLFCLAMAPLSHAIKALEEGYSSSSGGRSAAAKFHLSHLFYMDDLKIYSKSAGGLDRVLNRIDQMSQSIGMRVNAAKCARAAHIPNRSPPEERGRADSGDTLDVKGLTIGESYKYLGIEQRLGIIPAEAWDRAQSKFMSRLENIWSLDLTFRQKVSSTNAIIPMITYVVLNSFKGGGTYRSTLKRGEVLDVQVRKLLVRQQARYKANSVDRLYLPPELGGLGLLSVRDSLAEATIYSWSYVTTRSELAKQLALFQSLANRGKRSVLSDALIALEETGCTATIDSQRSVVLFDSKEYDNPRELARAVTSAMRHSCNTRRSEAWKSLQLAGGVSRAKIDLHASSLWVRSGKVASVVARNVIAAQEGCLLVRAAPTCKTANKNCRKCGKSWETADHVVTHCSAWLPTLYVYRHDLVAQRVHYRLCIQAGLKPPHYSQKVPGVMTNKGYKLMWGQPIQTGALVKHNKPDIVLYDLKGRNVTIVEIAVSWYTRLEQQRQLKTNRYTVNGNIDAVDGAYPAGDNLKRDLESQGWRTTFVPLVIGACGEVDKQLLEGLERLGLAERDIRDCVEHMSRSAVLGTNRVIKNHLA